MHLVDTALAARIAGNRPIRVGMIGAGFMARGVALQLVKYVKGFNLLGVSNRHIDGAARVYTETGMPAPAVVSSVSEFDALAANGTAAITEDPMLLCESEHIDVILEITGAVEFGAHVVVRALDHGKHVVMMNAELDSTIGPLLKTRADSQGLVLTNVDGDQPGVIMNLFRFVQGMGVRPRLCGNIKGLQDPYRNPTTQKSFAERWKQKPAMVTSFADGSKISFEQAIVANATGMRVAQRGMYGPVVEPGTSIEHAPSWYPESVAESETGIVDYVVGASPGPGVFVLGTHDDPAQQHYLELYKLGTGPLYCFHTPYHLCHFEVPNTIARAVLFNDAAIAPQCGLQVDVVATAKSDLQAGSTIDGIGHYMTYGQCENADVVFGESLLPMGLAEGCVLKRDISKDTVLTYNDVQLPANRLCDVLRDEQNTHFFG